jgi:hypothetical protein
MSVSGAFRDEPRIALTASEAPCELIVYSEDEVHVSGFRFPRDETSIHEDSPDARFPGALDGRFESQHPFDSPGTLSTKRRAEIFERRSMNTRR